MDAILALDESNLPDGTSYSENLHSYVDYVFNNKQATKPTGIDQNFISDFIYEN